VGNGNAICLYDMKEIPFFMIVFERLNLYIQAQVVALVDGLPIEEDETNMFGVRAFVEKSSWALVIRELSLFQRLVIPPVMCANPFTWWKTHEGQFPNVDFLTKQVLGITRFQIET